MAGINDISTDTGLTADVVTDVFNAVLKRAQSGERVTIRGFGSFYTKKQEGRTLNAPVLPGPSEVPERITLRFKPSDKTRQETGDDNG